MYFLLHSLSVLAASPSKYFFLFSVLGKRSRRGKEKKGTSSLSKIPVRGVKIQGNISRRI
jgi:hypothetical protein